MLKNTIKFATVVVAGYSIPAYAQESCGDLLRYSSRDVSSQISYNDFRKSVYNMTCENNNANAGLDYKGANGLLGLNYGSKEEYCKTEQQINSQIVFNQANSNLVVRQALDSYVQCRALSVAGVQTSISLPSAPIPTVFSMSVRRSSAAPQSVTAVRLDPNSVKCSVQKKGISTALASSVNDINFSLPASDARWTLLCSRTPVGDKPGQETYPQVQIVLATTAGDLTLYLPEAGYLPGQWAKELSNKIVSTNTRIDNISIKFSREPALYDISNFNGEVSCPADQVAYGFRNASVSNQSLDMWRCTTISLSIPPKE